eukprot:464529-Lingulodinium_polyedra.AAC.1
MSTAEGVSHFGKKANVHETMLERAAASSSSGGMLEDSVQVKAENESEAVVKEKATALRKLK